MTVRKRTWTDKQGTLQTSWTVDFVFKHPNGTTERIREKSPVNTKEGAREYERRRREALLNPEAPAAKIAPTLNEFEPHFRVYSQNNNKKSSIHSKDVILRAHLKPYFGDVRLNEIDLAAIETYKAVKTAGGLAAKTVNNHLIVLKKLLNLAIEMSKLDKHPKIRLLKLPPQTFEFLTFEETSRFLAATPPEWYCMMLFALRTGLRLGELLELKWEDIDLVAGRVVVKRSIWRGEVDVPKSGHGREVPLSGETIAALKSHRHLRGPYVFCREDGAAFTHDMDCIKGLVAGICKKAGLAKRLTMHDLRHTFASHLVMRGIPIKVVQELLGHSDIQTTMRYAHLSPDVKQDAVRVLDLAPIKGQEEMK